ncbi:DUF4265 domain-containing protein [Chitinophaga alhagiae]|uniref:DUF4265 domain-containing protein n=1 Tax=Chitinophaga alhagiae TaxID=2203219 RepID=UPI000E5B07E3|nr:DUF4265 domain-containing protein [Chitinophaga alhagiae]
MTNDPVNITFRFHSSVLGEETTEILPAEAINGKGGQYKIKRIPLYVLGVAWGDIVRAEHNADGNCFTCLEIIAPSGHSTVQVMLMQTTKNEEALRGLFRDMGCGSVSAGSGYFVLDVPANLDYGPVKPKLEQLSGNGVLDYAEALLSDNHRPRYFVL